MRFFRRSRAVSTPPATKSASFFLSLGAGKAGLSGAAFDRLAAEGYAGCVVAFACINKIAAAVASVEPQLYRKGRGGKLTRVESHPVLDLLDRPNPAQSGMEFTLELAAYHRLAGNAFVFGNGPDPSRPPNELQLLSPGKVQVKPGPGYLPAVYEYRPDGTRKIDYPVDQVTGSSAVLHLKSFNPLSAWSGLSPLSAAALSVDVHTGGQEWNKRLIENGARPSGALVVKAADGKPAELSDEQYQRLREMMDAQFSGQGNAGRPMLLEGGLEWQEMSISPKDMDFLEGKHSAARDIALAYGVPPQLIGIPGDSTFANYEMAKLSFWSETVIPLICWYYAGFNRWLVPRYGENLYLWYDEEMIPALEPLRKAKADRVNAAGYMTVNEKRAAMGLDDVPGGDVLLVASGLIPLELAGAVDLSEPGSEADREDDEPEEEEE